MALYLGYYLYNVQISEVEFLEWQLTLLFDLVLWLQVGDLEVVQVQGLEPPLVHHLDWVSGIGSTSDPDDISL